MKYSLIWPVITEIGTKLPDAAEWNGIGNKFENHFSETPGKGNV
jgi:ferredoxin